MKKVLVLGRIPQEHANQLEAIMAEMGKCESESVAQMATRLTTVENRLAKLQELFLNT